MLSLLSYIKNPRNLGVSLLTHFGGWIPDKPYIKLLYWFKMRRKLNLDKPETYNEKLQWLKLYYRNPSYTEFVDKYAVKEYVANTIGDEFIIPTIGVWTHPEDIQWETLPNQFVIKTTHGGGNCGVIICKDKESFDFVGACSRIKTALKQNIYKSWREWPYKNVVPRIIAEPYMEDKRTNELRDYKFFCFDGQIKALFVGTERQKAGEDVKFDFFDPDYNHLPFKQGHKWAKKTPEKPDSFNLMKTLVEKLSQGFPHVRIDMYEVNGHPYFGEMTFYHFGGMVPFNPEEWDKRFGEWLRLPEKL